MSTSTRYIAVGLLIGCAALAHTVSAQRPTFRAGTDAVYVVATVMAKDGSLVTDLTGDDFEIRDNGEPVPISVFRNDPVPFSAVVMFDISPSMFGDLGLMRAGVDAFVRQFQPGDRANIGTFAATPVVGPHFSANPQVLLNWVSASMSGTGTPCFIGRPWRVMYPMAGSAVWDAALCAVNTLYGDSETPRRVVVLVADAKNCGSSSRLADVERQADALGVIFYTIGMHGRLGLDVPALRELAERTGGGYFVLRDDADLPQTFARIAGELRRQYVFGFSSANASGRRHKIEVRTRRPELTVHARQVDVEPLAVNATPGSGGIPDISTPDLASRAPNLQPRTAPLSRTPRAAITDLWNRFEQGDWDYRPSLESGRFLALISDGIRHDAPAWIAERGLAVVPRRRLAVATHALTVLQSVDDPWLWQDTQAASKLLESACALLQQDRPNAAERAWHGAAVAVLERFPPAPMLGRHLQHASARFPDEPRWALVRALAAEASAQRDLQLDGRITMPRSHAAKVAAAYESATAYESARAEAHLRWGYHELVLGRPDEALRHFDLAGDPEDAVLRYWLHLFKGQALERANRISEAIASYRLAVGDAPFAQSASLALAAALVTDRRTSEAAAGVTQALVGGEGQRPTDPVVYYDTPDLRFWPGLMAELRRAIVR